MKMYENESLEFAAPSRSWLVALFVSRELGGRWGYNGRQWCG